jgi:membrane protease YdiL (CAAX protease family)
MDSEQLVRLLEYVEEREIELRSLVIVRNGYVVLETYYYPFSADLKNRVCSVTKSFASALYPAALVLAFVLAVAGTPLAGLAPAFGEEYAWRGILQSAWLGYGKRQGAFLVGLVWGLWHIPVILGGIHTYPPKFYGLLLALVFSVLWGLVQSYGVLKTGSIWVAALLHGLVNSVYAFGLTYLVRPTDKIRSFGLQF